MFPDRQAQAALQTQDARLLQKINGAHREAFQIKYPNQIEHCLRLTCERLQAGLDKRAGCDIAVPSTWRMSPSELHDLAQTAYLLNEIRKGF